MVSVSCLCIFSSQSIFLEAVGHQIIYDILGLTSLISVIVCIFSSLFNRSSTFSKSCFFYAINSFLCLFDLGLSSWNIAILISLSYLSNSFILVELSFCGFIIFCLLLSNKLLFVICGYVFSVVFLSGSFMLFIVSKIVYCIISFNLYFVAGLFFLLLYFLLKISWLVDLVLVGSINYMSL